MDEFKPIQQPQPQPLGGLNGFIMRLVKGTPAVLAVLAGLSGSLIWAIHLEDRVNLVERELIRVADDNRRAIESEQRRLDVVNQTGTPAMQIIVERQRVQSENIVRLNERITTLEALRTQIEILRVTIQRLDEQQSRRQPAPP